MYLSNTYTYVYTPICFKPTQFKPTTKVHKDTYTPFQNLKLLRP